MLSGQTSQRQITLSNADRLYFLSSRFRKLCQGGDINTQYTNLVVVSLYKPIHYLFNRKVLPLETSACNPRTLLLLILLSLLIFLINGAAVRARWRSG